MECQTARLIYTPNKEQAHEMRKWIREIYPTSETIFDYKTSNDVSKYFESKQGENFILSISAVNSADAAVYRVHCGGRHFTRRSNLGVSVNTYGELFVCCFFFSICLNSQNELRDSDRKFSLMTCISKNDFFSISHTPLVYELSIF
jgi:hypothetical protein